MPRRLLKRLIPSQERLRSIKGLGFIGDQLFHPALWHLSRRSVRNAVFLGIAFVFIPLPGHVLIGALCAVWLRCNVALTVALIWINNPLTIAPLYFSAYKLGAWLLGLDVAAGDFHVDMETLQAIGWPFLLGCMVLAAVSGMLCAVAVDVAWRISVRQQWQTRSTNAGRHHWRKRVRERIAREGSYRGDQPDLSTDPEITALTRDGEPVPDPAAPHVEPDRARQQG